MVILCKKFHCTDSDSHMWLVIFLHKIRKCVWILGGRSTNHMFYHYFDQDFDATPGGMLCLPTLNDNCYSKPLLLMGKCHVTRYIREQKNKIITTWTINFRVLNFGLLQVYLDLLLLHGWSYKPSVRHDNSRKTNRILRIRSR